MNKFEKNIEKVKVVNVPTALLTALACGAKFNNEIDATLENIYFKYATLSLLSRGVDVTKYTDGANELWFIGLGADQKRWTGASVLSR